MRILISAYACEPGRGSEPGAGWAWACAAAEDHEVWVLTHETNRESCTSALDTNPELATRLHLVFLRNSRWARPLRRFGVTKRLYYIIWQLTVCRIEARALHRVVCFDVAHHLTYAADWLPVGVANLGSVPFVWGPVGGATSCGWRLWALTGPVGFLSEVARAALAGAARLLVGRPVARRASLVLAQNSDVAAVFERDSDVIVQPNVALLSEDLPNRNVHLGADGSPVAVFAGRLLAWKGLRTALRALRRPEASEWQLHIYGDGPERRRLERAAVDWGLAGRVDFFGNRPRMEVRAALAEASVMLFPSIHDAAGWAVAEATEAGCPVVALDIGGPPTLLGSDDGVVVGLDGDVVAGLASALDRARRCVPVPGRWSADRLPLVLDEVYRRVSAEAQASLDSPRSAR